MSYPDLAALATRLVRSKQPYCNPTLNLTLTLTQPYPNTNRSYPDLAALSTRVVRSKRARPSSAMGRLPTMVRKPLPPNLPKPLAVTPPKAVAPPTPPKEEEYVMEAEPRLFFNEPPPRLKPSKVQFVAVAVTPEAEPEPEEEEESAGDGGEEEAEAPAEEAEQVEEEVEQWSRAGSVSQLTEHKTAINFWGSDW